MLGEQIAGIYIYAGLPILNPLKIYNFTLY